MFQISETHRSSYELFELRIEVQELDGGSASALAEYGHLVVFAKPVVQNNKPEVINDLNEPSIYLRRNIQRWPGSTGEPRSGP
jgi:hypothetical protein